jgi:hypothetical protein
VVDIAYKERKIAILLECQVKFLFLSKKSHMFTKAICKNYAISAFPGYPGIAGEPVRDKPQPGNYRPCCVVRNIDG